MLGCTFFLGLQTAQSRSYSHASGPKVGIDCIHVFFKSMCIYICVYKYIYIYIYVFFLIYLGSSGLSVGPASGQPLAVHRAILGLLGNPLLRGTT